MGLAGRALGLTLDRVTAFDVVTADGERERVQARLELFWALRGGGGSFAVVTAVSCARSGCAAPRGSTLAYPENAREEVLAAWDDLAPGAPAALTVDLHADERRRERVRPVSRLGDGAAASGRPARTDRRRPLQRRDERLPRPPAPLGGLRGTAAAAACRARRFDAASVYVARRLSARGAARVPRGRRRRRDARSSTPTAARSTRWPPMRRRSCTGTPASASRSSPTARRARAPARTPRAGADRSVRQRRGVPELRRPRPALTAHGAYYGANLERLRAIKRALDPEGRFAPVQGIR